jgi:biopolymer transport protein ExbD
MRKSSIESYEDSVGKIPITPMINVALLLVLFFMMTAPAIFMSGISVKNPTLIKGSTASDDTELKVNVYIDSKNRLHLNEQLIKWEEFPDRVAELLGRSVSRIVVVSAYPSVPIQEVVTVMDISKQKGALKLVLLRRKEK